MSILPALGARPLPSPLSLYGANAKNDGSTLAANAARPVKPVDAAAPQQVSDGLSKHVAAVGSATVDFAQSFVNSFAQSLFGDAGKDAVISFDSASLDTTSSVAVGVQHSSGPKGSSDAAAFALTDSSHFIGKGTITTTDGRKFDFEVEVQYDAELSGAASQTTNNNASGPLVSANQPARSSNASNTTNSESGSDNLPSVQVPNIDFPGTLADLFKLIGRDLQSALSTGDNNRGQASDGIDRNTLRSLSLRLLSLADSKDTNTYSAPSAADKAKAAADATQTAVTTAPEAPVKPTQSSNSALPAPADDPISTDVAKATTS